MRERRERDRTGQDRAEKGGRGYGPGPAIFSSVKWVSIMLCLGELSEKGEGINMYKLVVITK